MHGALTMSIYDKYTQGFEDDIYQRNQARSPYEGFSDYRTEFLDANDRRTPAQIRAEYNKAAAVEEQQRKLAASTHAAEVFLRENKVYRDCAANTEAMTAWFRQNGIAYPAVRDYDMAATALLREGRLIVNEEEVAKLQDAALDAEVEQLRQSRLREATTDPDSLSTAELRNRADRQLQNENARLDPQISQQEIESTTATRDELRQRAEDEAYIEQQSPAEAAYLRRRR
jgi:hypothetical protein